MEGGDIWDGGWGYLEWSVRISGVEGGDIWDGGWGYLEWSVRISGVEGGDIWGGGWGYLGWRVEDIDRYWLTHCVQYAKVNNKARVEGRFSTMEMLKNPTILD